MHSQNNEEEIILNYFKGRTTGRLMDIGAFDGKNLSNSYALIESGWSGVLIEASPTNFTSLISNYPFLDKIEAVNVAIGAQTGLVQFHDSGEMVSSTDPDHVTKWNGNDWKSYKIMMLGAHDLNLIYPDAFDFINVDVEGYSADLFLELLPLYESTLLWCVEHDNKLNQVRSAASRYGLTEIGFNGENLIFAK